MYFSQREPQYQINPFVFTCRPASAGHNQNMGPLETFFLFLSLFFGFLCEILWLGAPVPN